MEPLENWTEEGSSVVKVILRFRCELPFPPFLEKFSSVSVEWVALFVFFVNNPKQIIPGYFRLCWILLTLFLIDQRFLVLMDLLEHREKNYCLDGICRVLMFTCSHLQCSSPVGEWESCEHHNHLHSDGNAADWTEHSRDT